MGEGLDVAGLISAARQGEDGALGRLLGLYRNYLRFLARSGLDETLRIKADPSDLAQDALLLAVERFAQFRGRSEGELMAWLRSILANTLAQLARRYHGTKARAVVRERSIEASLNQSSANLGKILRDRGLSPRHAAQRRERSVFLADALAQLSNDHRQVIVLRDLEQRSWEDVGQRMGRAPNAVRMLWTRALAKLGPLLEERGLE